MTITAKIVLDSVGPDAQRLTTFQLRYPRFIHSEFMTHRVFSRNASSSRAMPVKRLIADIRADPAMPISWGANQKGMQAGAELAGWRRWACRTLWLTGMHIMTRIAAVASWCGAHKQTVNRLIEPWAHISVVMTTTRLKNLWKLRDHKDAQPEFRELARQMRLAYDVSYPQYLEYEEYHLPYVDIVRDKLALGMALQGREIDLDDLGHNLTAGLIKLSVARCARVSYLTHDKQNPKVKDDINLFNRLVGGNPLHASPTEHQGKPDRKCSDGEWLCPAYHGNLTGWQQYRKTLVGEDGDAN